MLTGFSAPRMSIFASLYVHWRIFSSCVWYFETFFSGGTMLSAVVMVVMMKKREDNLAMILIGDRNQDYSQLSPLVIDVLLQLVDLQLLGAGGQLQVPLVLLQLVHAVVVLLAQVDQCA